MRIPVRLASLIGLSLMLTPAAAPREMWIHARTEHFEMFSCASESTSREVLAKLEQFRATVLRIFPLRNDREPPTTVILFDSDRRFEPYRPRRNGESEEAGGYCIHGPAEAVIVLSAEYDRDTTRGLVYHEYVHLLLAARGDNPPLWLNEGLAEFFSTFAVRKDKFDIGRHKPELVEVLRSQDLMPLGRLFAVTNQASEYHEGSARDVFYAESWLLVHYLICGDDSKILLPALIRFVDLSSAPDVPIDTSFQKAFGMNYHDMERRLQSYLHGGSYRGRGGQLLLADLPSRIEFAPAGAYERDLALVGLRWRLQQPGDVTYQLMQLANQRPDSPRPYELLAIVAAQSNDEAGALERWQRAAELGSKNGYAYLVLARDKLDQLLRGFSLDYRLPDNLAVTLRGWLDRAIDLNPNYLHAFEALALVEAMAERPRMAVVNRIQEAVPQMRDRALTLFALAILHWRANQNEVARQIDELLLISPQVDPQVRASAEALHIRLPPPAAAASGGANSATPK